MKSKILAELQNNYISYMCLWDLWIKSGYCNLNEEDIYIIKTHNLNNFEISIEGMLMFYNRDAVLDRINQKLVNNYCRYQAWIMLHFASKMMAFAVKHGLEICLLTPICLLDIPEELKTGLLKFRYKTIQEVLVNIAEINFTIQALFDNICNIVDLLNENMNA